MTHSFDSIEPLRWYSQTLYGVAGVGDRWLFIQAVTPLGPTAFSLTGIRVIHRFGIVGVLSTQSWVAEIIETEIWRGFPIDLDLFDPPEEALKAAEKKVKRCLRHADCVAHEDLGRTCLKPPK